MIMISKLEYSIYTEDLIYNHIRTAVGNLFEVEIFYTISKLVIKNQLQYIEGSSHFNFFFHLQLSFLVVTLDYDSIFYNQDCVLF